MILDPWPFAVVPDRERARHWAGRPNELKALTAMMGAWQRRRSSDITVLWADFGQGKTHSLLHIADTLRRLDDPSLVHYVQLPPLTAGSPFVALYRQLLQDFPLERVAADVFRHFERQPMALFSHPHPGERRTLQLLWLIATRGPGASAASSWLRGDKVSASALRDLTVAGKLIPLGPAPATTQDAQTTLDLLLRAAKSYPMDRPNRVVLLLDEFQRLGELSNTRRIEVCSGLHLIFNAHPQQLHLVLAFAGGLPGVVERVLTGDLMARVVRRVDYHPMSFDEARSYVASLLRDYGHGSSSHGRGLYFPFSAEAVNRILHMAQRPGNYLSPRRINVTFDRVANAALEDGRLDHSSPYPIDELVVESAIATFATDRLAGDDE